MAGASGFIGRALVPSLLARHRVVALGRSGRAAAPAGAGLEGRRCDLLSLLDAERGVAGADVGFYLVHSMLPTARLSQASFEDVDLIAADNFARAARRAGLSRIVYLGGLVPGGDAARLSPHLRSRLEVEGALRSSGVPTTVVRAGLVLGAGGSSFEMLVRLVDRLPALVCPAWTATPTQPVALDDVVRVLAASVDDPEVAGKVVEVGCPEPTTYRALMEEMARALGRKRWFVSVPFFSPRLSRLWVRTVTGAPRELVDPLVESLEHSMVAADLSDQERLAGPPTPLRAALDRALADRARRPDTALERMRRRAARSAPSGRDESEAPTVTSIQRLPLPAGWSAADVAREFGGWLPRGFRPFLAVEVGRLRCGGEEGEFETVVRFRTRLLARPLLVLALAPERSAPDRTLFRVRGGLLALRPAKGLLEFRVAPAGGAVLAAIRDFSPRMPWLLYRFSQAPVHLAVMRAFGRHLGRIARSGGRGSAPRAEAVGDLLEDGPLLGRDPVADPEKAP